jgi:amylosucrase
MMHPDWIAHNAQLSLERIWPRIAPALADLPITEQNIFEQRLRREWPRLFGLLVGLYNNHYDCFYHLEQILLTVAASWVARPEWLKQLDAQREHEPHWYLDEKALGGVLYVDRFAGTLAGLRKRVPYLKELGLTYLHLMPLFAAPAGNSDGGYAVSSYRQVNPELGTIEELGALAQELRAEGISLVVDFVFNHTSDEHEWASKAQAGDPVFQGYYYLFPDRTMPDAYEQTLREIFPTVRRGSFTWREDMQHWVWTTFNSFQWDLNYANPEVFIANTGIEILRFDAVAFIWKQIGTSCENLPQAHELIQAFNALVRIAAPALIFKSEAIVHPDDVIRYISPGECQISYNPTLMALLWESLATSETRLLAHSMRHRYKLPAGTAWVNYLRCHDDIGWTFDDGDAQRIGINPYGHRHFLNDFYTGKFAGSFARGLPFQENPDTGDARISGTLASLAGLEHAIQSGDEQLVQFAIRRIIMLHGLILSTGGVPLLYIGDELAQLNDYQYAADPAKAGDSRWVHRPALNWDLASRRHDPTTPEGQTFSALRHLIQQRKNSPALRGGEIEVIDTDNKHLLGFIRFGGGQRILVLANFSARSQPFDANRLRVYGPGYQFSDLVNERTISADRTLSVEPYQLLWLVPG